MSTFDVVSEVDRQEVRNAIDQAQREIATRFDFKNTNSSIEQNDLVITLRTVSEDRLAALRAGDGGEARQAGGVAEGRRLRHGRGSHTEHRPPGRHDQGGHLQRQGPEINRTIKEKGPKGVSSQTQGDTVRVTGKKRDDLQAVMALLKGADLEIPLQFNNFPRLTLRHRHADLRRAPATVERSSGVRLRGAADVADRGLGRWRPPRRRRLR